MIESLRAHLHSRMNQDWGGRDSPGGRDSSVGKDHQPHKDGTGGNQTPRFCPPPQKPLLRIP